VALKDFSSRSSSSESQICMDFNGGDISDTEALLHIRDVAYLHGDQWVLAVFVCHSYGNCCYSNRNPGISF